MKITHSFSAFRALLILVFFVFSKNSSAQVAASSSKPKSLFWQKVQFGGGIGLNIGSGFTDVSIAPSAIYNVNKTVSIGAGLQGSYVAVKNSYNSVIAGASLIGLINPLPEIQLSVELEELNVSTSFNTGVSKNKTNFWNTGLYLGGGYRMGNVTAGIKYNVLFDKNKSVYNDAVMPFVRVYF